MTFTCEAYHEEHPDLADVSWSGANLSASREGTAAPLVTTTSYSMTGSRVATCCVADPFTSRQACGDIELSVNARDTCACEDASISVENPADCAFDSFTCASWHEATFGESGDQFTDGADASIDGCELKLTCR